MPDTTKWRMLFVDDDADTCRQVKEFLEGETIATGGESPIVETSTDFNEALTLLEARRFDLVILDVRLGPYSLAASADEMGIKTLNAIREKTFIPVVFYTGLPRLVRDLATPLIRVVEKTEKFPKLLEEVQNIFATRLPALHRALIRHIETIQRDYMWNFVAKNWDNFGDTADRASLAYLVARRLALSLSESGIQRLARDLGDPSGLGVAENTVHPMQYYVLPPVDPSPLSGDLYSGQIEQTTGYWMLLTPSCDIVAGREKADNLLFAFCLPLSEQVEYTTWREDLANPKPDVESKLKSLLKNRREKFQPERFFYLPGALILPDLLVDFQSLIALPREQTNGLKRLASLDSPFAEAVTSRFARYFGRLGTPDLDVDFVIARLTLEAKRGGKLTS